VLLVGARLFSPLIPRLGLAGDDAAAVESELVQLPTLPNELWAEVLKWLLRSELGAPSL
jgi:hypothetical protein